MKTSLLLQLFLMGHTFANVMQKQSNEIDALVTVDGSSMNKNLNLAVGQSENGRTAAAAALPGEVLKADLPFGIPFGGNSQSSVSSDQTVTVTITIPLATSTTTVTTQPTPGLFGFFTVTVTRTIAATTLTPLPTTSTYSITTTVPTTITIPSTITVPTTTTSSTTITVPSTITVGTTTVTITTDGGFAGFFGRTVTTTVTVLPSTTSSTLLPSTALISLISPISIPTNTVTVLSTLFATVTAPAITPFPITVSAPAVPPVPVTLTVTSIPAPVIVTSPVTITQTVITTKASNGGFFDGFFPSSGSAPPTISVPLPISSSIILPPPSILTITTTAASCPDNNGMFGGRTPQMVTITATASSTTISMCPNPPIASSASGGIDNGLFGGEKTVTLTQLANNTMTLKQTSTITVTPPTQSSVFGISSFTPSSAPAMGNAGDLLNFIKQVIMALQNDLNSTQNPLLDVIKNAIDEGQQQQQGDNDRRSQLLLVFIISQILKSAYQPSSATLFRVMMRAKHSDDGIWDQQEIVKFIFG